MHLELRLYSIPHGRMADVRRRMLADVQPVLHRHGFGSAVYWTALAGPRLPSFLWMIGWPDAAARERAWTSFYDDADWWRIRAASNAGSELVEDYGLWFMRPHRLLLEFDTTPQLGSLHELVVMDIGIGRSDEVSDVVERGLVETIRSSGGKVSGMFDIVAGARIPSIVIWVTWPDFDTRSRWHDSYLTSPIVRAAGAGLLGRSDNYLLRPEQPTALDIN